MSKMSMFYSVKSIYCLKKILIEKREEKEEEEEEEKERYDPNLRVDLS